MGGGGGAGGGGGGSGGGKIIGDIVAQTVQPAKTTERSVYQLNVSAAAIGTLMGPCWPEYRVPPIVR